MMIEVIKGAEHEDKWPWWPLSVTDAILKYADLNIYEVRKIEPLRLLLDSISTEDELRKALLATEEKFDSYEWRRIELVTECALFGPKSFTLDVGDLYGYDRPIPGLMLGSRWHPLRKIDRQSLVRVPSTYECIQKLLAENGKEFIVAPGNVCGIVLRNASALFDKYIGDMKDAGDTESIRELARGILRSPGCENISKWDHVAVRIDSWRFDVILSESPNYKKLLEKIIEVCPISMEHGCY